jgi:hypothetical protein
MPSIHAQLHTYFTALKLFDTGAYTSKWLEQLQPGGTVTGAHHVKSSRNDVPTSEVGLASTQLSSSMYGSVVFDLTFFNEVTKSDNTLNSIEANVIDSCIEVFIDFPRTSTVPTPHTYYHHKVSRKRVPHRQSPY